MTNLAIIKTHDLIRITGLRHQDTANNRHKLIMGLFPQNMGDNPRANNLILFRKDTTPKGSHYLIRTTADLINNPAIKHMKEPDTLQQGRTVAFRVTASVIKRTKGKGESPILEQEPQEDWILERLQPALTNTEIINQQTEQLPRTHHDTNNHLHLTTFDGIATINDPQELKKLLNNGIGRNKNYGAGLLTVKYIA